MGTVSRNRLRFWPWVVAAFTGWLSIWPSIKWFLEWAFRWGEHIEFAINRIHDLKGVGPMLEFFFNPPPWLAFVLLPVAALAVWYALRKQPSQNIVGDTFHSATIIQTEPTESQRRLELIRKAREFVLRACKKDGAGTDFRQKLSAYAPYYELRPYLSEEFQTKWNKPRTIHVFAVDTNLPDIAVFFLNELERLEKEWRIS